MTDVVTQPYDKITPDMQDRYYAASPHNLIRVILGKQQPRDTDTENVYTRAAKTLNDWRTEGILKEETEPALYGYAQTYTVPKAPTKFRRQRRGFIALGHQLSDYADQVWSIDMSRRFPNTRVTGWHCSKRHARIARADLHALLRPDVYGGEDYF